MEKARRALAEFRIRGVATNIAFLQAVLADPECESGRVTTSFIEDHPQLLSARSGNDRGTKLLTYLADVTLNQPYGAAPTTLDPAAKLPPLSLDVPAPDGSRQDLLRHGPEELARRLRERPDVAVTDRMFRDAHQLATRVRTHELLAAAGHVVRLTPQQWSVECWGGATYDVALRFLSEDPWERLAVDRVHARVDHREQGRPDGSHHRGHEDGGSHHRAGSRHGDPHRRVLPAEGRRRRSVDGAEFSCSCVKQLVNTRRRAVQPTHEPPGHAHALRSQSETRHVRRWTLNDS